MQYTVVPPVRRMCLMTAVLVLAMPAAAAAQTLNNLLAQHGVTLDSASAALANRPITSYAVGDSAGTFAVAWYWATGSSQLPDTLNISMYDRASRSWLHAALPREQTDTTGGRLKYSVGSALRVSRSRDHLFVDTHINPSAGTLLVLSEKLELVTALNGWSELLLPGGAMVYQRSTVHFASTHPAELWLYDPGRRRDVALYPTQPYAAVRREYVERVRDIYARLGEDWFRLNNHHMMAEQFESNLGDPVADSTGTRIAFIARFGDGGGSRAATPLVEVLVVCVDVTRESRCTELELSALRQLHPDWSDARILQDALARGGSFF